MTLLHEKRLIEVTNRLLEANKNTDLSKKLSDFNTRDYNSTTVLIARFPWLEVCGIAPWKNAVNTPVYKVGGRIKITAKVTLTRSYATQRWQTTARLECRLYFDPTSLAMQLGLDRFMLREVWCRLHGTHGSRVGDHLMSAMRENKSGGVGEFDVSSRYYNAPSDVSELLSWYGEVLILAEQLDNTTDDALTDCLVKHYGTGYWAGRLMQRLKSENDALKQRLIDPNRRI